MKALRTYLDQIRASMHEPARQTETLQTWRGEGTTHPSNARGLSFYVKAARHRRVEMARSIYGRLFDLLPAEDRRALLDAYLGADGGDDPDWYRNTERLAQTVQGLVGAGTLHPATAELAQHLWLLFAATLHREPPAVGAALDDLRANPTIEIAEYAYPVTDWMKRPAIVGAYPDPSPAPLLVAYYLHPSTLKPWWRVLGEVELAALRIAEESIPLDDAADQAGITVAALCTALQDYVDKGLLVARS